MGSIKCKLVIHKWSDWVEIERDQLIKSCHRCTKTETYIGMTQRCMDTGYRSPYIFKH